MVYNYRVFAIINVIVRGYYEKQIEILFGFGLYGF